MTDYSELLEAGRVKQGRFSHQQVTDCLRIARRDLQVAADVIGNSPEWAFNIAYNAMHQAGRAFMFHSGYRTTGEGHHATVVRFLEIGLGKKHQELLRMLDRMRRKRNRATYIIAGTISRTEAEEALAAAREFVTDISHCVRPRAE